MASLLPENESHELSIMLTTYYTLHITHYLFLITHYSLLITHYSLLISHFSLPILASTTPQLQYDSSEETYRLPVIYLNHIFLTATVYLVPEWMDCS